MYAGVILGGPDSNFYQVCVPRVCGGDPKRKISGRLLRLVFPVYAGVILNVVGVDGNTSCVPRVCGGDPVCLTVLRSLCRCSPCMRG